MGVHSEDRKNQPPFFFFFFLEIEVLNIITRTLLDYATFEPIEAFLGERKDCGQAHAAFER